MKHTPTPWNYEEDILAKYKKTFRKFGIEPFKYHNFTILSGGKYIAICGCHEETQANAKFICLACNNHYALVKALKEISETEGLSPRDRLARAENIIKAMKKIAKDALSGMEK